MGIFADFGASISTKLADIFINKTDLAVARAENAETKAIKIFNSSRNGDVLAQPNSPEATELKKHLTFLKESGFSELREARSFFGAMVEHEQLESIKFLLDGKESDQLYYYAEKSYFERRDSNDNDRYKKVSFRTTYTNFGGSDALDDEIFKYAAQNTDSAEVIKALAKLRGQSLDIYNLDDVVVEITNQAVIKELVDLSIEYGKIENGRGVPENEITHALWGMARAECDYGASLYIDVAIDLEKRGAITCKHFNGNMEHALRALRPSEEIYKKLLTYPYSQNAKNGALQGHLHDENFNMTCISLLLENGATISPEKALEILTGNIRKNYAPHKHEAYFGLVSAVVPGVNADDVIIEAIRENAIAQHVAAGRIGPGERRL